MERTPRSPRPWRPIRVAHVTNVALILHQHLLHQLCAIRDAGYDVAGISAPGLELESASVEAAGIPHIPVPMTRNFTPLADLKSLWSLYRVMRREEFGIVHTHNPKPGLLGQLAARMAGVPVVINTLHGFYLHEHMNPLWRHFYILTERFAARCSDLILSQSREDVGTAIEERICPSNKIKYLGNGIDVEAFDRTRLDRDIIERKRRDLGIPPSSPVVGFVGRLVAEKGIHELLRAAAIVAAKLPEARFLIVGPIDDEKLDAVTPDTAREYGVGTTCVFAGMRSDMPDLYALMDVFSLPSHREGFPRSAMEASAMGVPAVVTDVRGCREAIVHDRNGLLVPLGDSEALANALLDLLTNSERARRMGEEGRRMAVAQFDERRVFAAVLAEYSRLLRQKGLVEPISAAAAGGRRG